MYDAMREREERALEEMYAIPSEGVDLVFMGTARELEEFLEWLEDLREEEE